ncbi:MAG: hypothetical protein M1840_000544 [Geoglossum simile]|nr:MAG: hypothetical protein M1840_000544 [Geoglossum simile]
MVKSLFWKLGFAALACQSGVQAVQQYVLDDDYSNFFDSFDFWTAADPTNGYVDYVDEAAARSLGILDDSSSAVKFGVEHNHNYPTGGRPSVRIQSKATYNKGLVIADIKHMPGGICGTWPAFWMNGPNWPDTGEIDIIEGVHLNTKNLMALHTDSTPGCTINGNGQTGTTSTFNCDTTTNTQPNNAGCAVNANSDNTYGAGFNKAGGGVYATEWTSSWIRIWFFPRGSIPADITAGIPNPSTWGTPSANFQGSCDIDAHFSNLQIIFDTTLCGDWAGNVWANSGCSSNTYPTCQSFAANPPSKDTFKDAYWEVNSLKHQVEHFNFNFKVLDYVKLHIVEHFYHEVFHYINLWIKYLDFKVLDYFKLHTVEHFYYPVLDYVKLHIVKHLYHKVLHNINLRILKYLDLKLHTVEHFYYEVLHYINIRILKYLDFKVLVYVELRTVQHFKYLDTKVLNYFKLRTVKYFYYQFNIWIFEHPGDFKLRILEHLNFTTVKYLNLRSLDE